MSNEEKILTILRKSRKAFLVEYGCGLFLFLLLVILWIKGIQLRPGVHNFVLGLALLSFATPEYVRLLTKYKITESKIVIAHGFIKQTKLNVYFAPLGYVPNINSKQKRIQRLLNYGTIYISSGGGGDSSNNFQIRDINNPKKVLKMIEDLVEKNKVRQSGRDS